MYNYITSTKMHLLNRLKKDMIQEALYLNAIRLRTVGDLSKPKCV